MVRTLQLKFIRSAMLAVTLVMALFLAAINILNYAAVSQDTNRVMQLILTQNSAMTPENGNPDPGAGEGELSEEPEENLERPESGETPPESSGTLSERPESGEAAPEEAESRGSPPERPDNSAVEGELRSENYFFVRFTSDGKVIYTDLSHVAALDADAAETIAESALAEGKSSGRVDGFLYAREEDQVTGGAVYAFLDAAEEPRDLLRTLVLTIAVGACAWGLVLLLVIFLSKKAIRPVAESIRKQKEFVTDAGHEIKTPLAIIQANADVLELHMGANKWIDNIRSQTKRLAALTQNLLTLSKMEEGNEKRLPASDFDAAAVLMEIAETYRESAELRKIELRGMRADAEVPFHFQKEIYVQLVNILMENAVKYAREGGYIEAAVRRSGHHVTLVFRNDTEDVLEGDPERLFDRFYRADKARSQKTGGSGIGLSVAKALCEGSGGTITAEYESERVIAFTARLRDAR